MYYRHDPKLAAGCDLYKQIKEQLENDKQLEQSPPTVNESNLVYYIDHLKEWIEKQNKTISDMQEVFQGIRKFTQF